jgi:hypothetical protein
MNKSSTKQQNKSSSILDQVAKNINDNGPAATKPNQDTGPDNPKVIEI